MNSESWQQIINKSTFLHLIHLPIEINKTARWYLNYKSFHLWLFKGDLTHHIQLTICSVSHHNAFRPITQQFFLFCDELAHPFSLPFRPCSLPKGRICWLILSLTVFFIVLVWSIIIGAIFPCVDSFSVFLPFLKIAFKFIPTFVSQKTIGIKLVIAEGPFIS